MKGNITLGIIFANTNGRSITQFADTRAAGSTPFGCRYRTIDFSLSAMVHANIDKVAVIPQSNYQSLMDHLGSGKAWDLARKNEGLFILPPFSQSGRGVYNGKVDAIAAAIPFLTHSREKYVLMADSDVVFNFPLENMINEHIQSEADITIAYKKHTKGGVGFTVEDGRITAIEHDIDAPFCENNSLDLFIIKKDLLISLIKQAQVHNYSDFMVDVLHRNIKSLFIKGYEAPGYAGIVDSMEKYYSQNMDLLDKDIRNDLFNKERPILTKMHDNMPTRYGFGSFAENSLIADGCVIEGEVRSSIIFRGVKIGKNAKIDGCILMQSTRIGENSVLNCVITDKNVTVNEGRTLTGYRSFPVYVPKNASV